MCQIIVNNGIEIETAFEFIKFLSIRKPKKEGESVIVTMDKIFTDFNLDGCLCPFNIRKTLTDNGIEFTENEGQMEFIVE